MFASLAMVVFGALRANSPNLKIMKQYAESSLLRVLSIRFYQRTNGPVKAHLISCPSKAQNLENIW